MLLGSYAECNRVLAVTCFVISIGIMGTFSSGIRVNCADLSPNFVSILMSLTSFFSLFGGLFAPSMAAWMTPNVLTFDLYKCCVFSLLNTFFFQ